MTLGQRNSVQHEPQTNGAGIAGCDTGPGCGSATPRSGGGRRGLFLVRADTATAARAFGAIVVRRQRRRQAIGVDRRRDLRLGRCRFDTRTRCAAANRLGFGSRLGRCLYDIVLLRPDFALDAALFGAVIGRSGAAAVATQAFALRAILPRTAIVASLPFFARLAFLAGLTLFARAAIVADLTLGAWLAIVAVATVVAISTVVTVAAIVALATVIALAAILAAGVGTHVAVAVEILVVVAVELVTGTALFLDARTSRFQHAEIMVGELEVIFGVHPVAGALGVGGEVLVFLQQLRGVAARTIVDAIAVITRVAAAASRLALSTATATAAGLTIVHQGLVVLSLPVRRSRDPGCEQLREAMHRHRPPAMPTGRQWVT